MVRNLARCYYTGWLVITVILLQDRNITFKMGTAIFGKFYRDEQTSLRWAVGRLEQGFAIYQPINSVFDNNILGRDPIILIVIVFDIEVN